jgi:hypothetical protein
LLFAAGESLIPDIVASQDSPSVREQFKSTVFDSKWNGTDLIMKSNVKPSVNPEICLDDGQTVFRPHLAEFWKSDEFAAEMSLLWMDNCPSHITCAVM